MQNSSYMSRWLSTISRDVHKNKANLQDCLAKIGAVDRYASIGKHKGNFGLQEKLAKSGKFNILKEKCRKSYEEIWIFLLCKLCASYTRCTTIL